VRVIVGVGGESVKGFIVLGTCEKRVIVAVKNIDENGFFIFLMIKPFETLSD
jgi:hypothetical protein